MRLLIACLFFLHLAHGGDAVPVLRVVNWSTYMEVDPAADAKLPFAERSRLLQEFMKEFGCRVDYLEFDNEDEIASYVLANLDSVDVVIDATEHLAARDGSLTWMPMPEAVRARQRPLRPEVKKVMDRLAAKGRIPYLAGTTGIVYRSDLTKEPASWADLYAAERSACLDSANSAFVADLRYRNIDFTDVDERQIQLSTRSLRDWLASGRVVSVTADLEKIEELLVAGEVSMALMWSGDALRMRAAHPEVPLNYRIPREGGDFFCEGWLVNLRTRHVDLAWSFTEFLLRPEIQVRLCKALHFQVVTQDALELLRKEHPQLANDPGLEPPVEVLQRCGDSNIYEHIDLLGPWNRACESAVKALKKP
jgi:spermidine/putrescine-binding protein